MIEIKIGGMSCENCARHVQEALSKLEGVRKVSINIEGGQALVEASGALDEAAIRAAIEEAGYEVQAIVRA
jgi:copper chaperone CopZ